VSELPVGVVGGGIVGLAIARELTRRYPGLAVDVLEKEPELALHQTGHNSGVVHAGVYYPPGSLKARLCTRGSALLRDFCRDRGLPFHECGKLVVAVDASEVDRLDALEHRAVANRVPGIRRFNADSIGDVEPHAAGLAALHSPHTAITDFGAVARAYGDDIESAGGRILLSTSVAAIERRTDAIHITTPSDRLRFRQVVICAGLQADRVASTVDGEDNPRIIPFRGEYLDVKPGKRDLVRGLIYPVPDPRYPFLGGSTSRAASRTQSTSGPTPCWR
jgi:L-2-hydroxyglutarate oxidase